MSNLFGLLLYLGTGALLHVIAIGPVFNPASMLGWGIVLGWPAILFGLIAAAAVIAAGLMKAADAMTGGRR